MGNECSPNEREFRYKALYEALHTIDNDIKQELNNTNIQSKKYYSYGLIDKEICKKYPFLINKTFDSKTARNKVFNYKDLIKKIEEKNFTYIHQKFEFCFPCDFIFINQDFLEVILGYVNEDIKKRLQTNFEFIIGGGCLLKKNINTSSSQFLSSFRYITLYNELVEERGNYTDFFLFINDKNKRESAITDILKNNLWNYFKKINYDYKDEYKKIIDDNNREIGYIVRVSEVNIIESFISRMKQKEKNENFMKQSKIENPQIINKQNNTIKKSFNENIVTNSVSNNNSNNINQINMPLISI